MMHCSASVQAFLFKKKKKLTGTIVTISSLVKFMYLFTVVKGPIKWLLFLIYFLNFMRLQTLNWNPCGRNSEKGNSQDDRAYSTRKVWKGENGIELTIDNPTQGSKEQEGQARTRKDLHLLYQENKCVCYISLSRIGFPCALGCKRRGRTCI